MAAAVSLTTLPATVNRRPGPSANEMKSIFPLFSVRAMVWAVGSGGGRKSLHHFTRFTALPEGCVKVKRSHNPKAERQVASCLVG